MSNDSSMQEMARYLQGEYNGIFESPEDLLARLELKTHTFLQGKEAKPVWQAYFNDPKNPQDLDAWAARPFYVVTGPEKVDFASFSMSAMTKFGAARPYMAFAEPQSEISTKLATLLNETKWDYLCNPEVAKKWAGQLIPDADTKAKRYKIPVKEVMETEMMEKGKDPQNRSQTWFNPAKTTQSLDAPDFNAKKGQPLDERSVCFIDALEKASSGDAESHSLFNDWKKMIVDSRETERPRKVTPPNIVDIKGEPVSWEKLQDCARDGQVLIVYKVGGCKPETSPGVTDDKATKKMAFKVSVAEIRFVKFGASFSSKSAPGKIDLSRFLAKPEEPAVTKPAEDEVPTDDEVEDSIMAEVDVSEEAISKRKPTEDAEFDAPVKQKKKKAKRVKSSKAVVEDDS